MAERISGRLFDCCSLPMPMPSTRWRNRRPDADYAADRDCINVAAMMFPLPNAIVAAWAASFSTGFVLRRLQLENSIEIRCSILCLDKRADSEALQPENMRIAHRTFAKTATYAVC